MAGCFWHLYRPASFELDKGSPVTVSSSPLVERRRLRSELRQARLDAGLTQEAVAQKMDWSLSKIIRIETGSVGISTNDLVALLRLYKVKDSQRIKDLTIRARAARQQTWWSKYRTILPPTYFQYIEYETSASIIRSYETISVPGLLQTEEYATSVVEHFRLKLPSKQVRTLVEVRMKRQELLLNQPKPPLLFFILDEAVIHRLIGDESLRKAQLEKLIDLSDRREVTIEVVPFNIGLHRGMSDNFNILEFPGPTDDVLYFESVRGAIFSYDATEEITLYRELFEDLRSLSLGPEGTRDYLIKAAGAIR
jgi:transcriptional regulator with XRE-family HTH domain